jgi:hypothetical protein
MVFALTVYLTLAIRRELTGAGTVAFAIVLNMVAAGIQATGSVQVTLGVPFDHNGIFHLVQTAAVLVLLKGLTAGLKQPARSSEQ